MKSATSEANTAEEVEVTPEMIEAGFYVLLDYESDELQSCDVAEQVYRVMRTVALQFHAGAPGSSS